jgi:hypothetical protein
VIALISLLTLALIMFSTFCTVRYGTRWDTGHAYDLNGFKYMGAALVGVFFPIGITLMIIDGCKSYAEKERVDPDVRKAQQQLEEYKLSVEKEIALAKIESERQALERQLERAAGVARPTDM